MRFAKSMIAAAAATILVLGCDGGPVPSGPTDPNLALQGPFPVTLPAPGDQQADPEEFEICKIGSSADFSYTITDLTTTPATVTTKTLHLDPTATDKGCEVVALKGGKGAIVSVTETGTPAGFQLDSARLIDVNGSHVTVVDRLILGTATVVDTIGGNGSLVGGPRGGWVRFYNSAIPPTGQIGDFVWDDVNGNGIQDAGEPGIQGLTVTLGGAGSATTTTDANGNYLFTGLAAGSYTVSVATPAGYNATLTGQGTAATDNNGSPANVTLATNSSVDLTIDFGFTHINTGSIGDFVWHDTNGNGIQDAGEPGIAGVTVTLSGTATGTTTTDATGHYLFSGLGAGSYTVTVTTPSGYTPSPSNQGGNPNTDSNGSPTSTTLASYNSSDLSLDFGFIPNPAGEIGDFVWNDLNGNGVQDAGEPGLGGVTVTLGGTTSGTTVTNGSGQYLFTGLGAGSYTVTVTCPNGYAPSPSNQGGDPAMDSNGSPAPVTLPLYNSTDYTIDFGCVAIPVGKIGDFVWNDLNGNGIQDAGEPGIPGLTVTLGGAASATTTTDANGGYLFTGLNAGNYTVTVGTPAGFAPTLTGQGTAATDNNGSPASVSLASYNSVDLTIDFGFVEIHSGQIGDFVWADLNGNGVQDAGEPGLSGVTVTLGGTSSGSTTTNGSGNYLFSGLGTGSYTVTVTCPNGYSPSPTGQGTSGTDSNGSPASVSLPTNTSTDLTIDFGCVPNPAGQIGDFVWKDTNGNGIQDAGEPGIGGVTVTLSGPVTASTVTNGSGAYLFTNLPQGSYTVTVTGGVPAGYTPTLTGQGTTATDNNGSPASVTLPTYNSVNLTIDFGYVPPAPPTGQIGDYVWLDENGDGKQTGSEPGIGGVTVTLTGPVNATTVTDGNGGYLFTGLPAGTYTVTVTDPTGLVPTQIGQGNPQIDNNPNPSTVVLATNSSVDLTIDFGYVPPQGVGRITGGGQQVDVGGVARIARGFTLHCDILLSNNLEINWGQGAGQHTFHITRPLRSAQCILDPKYRQPPPAAPFNTFIGVADGTIDGVPGAHVNFTFIDAGEPGRNDKASIQVYNAANQLVLNIPLSYLDNGNIQAHYDQPHGSNVNGPVGNGK